MGNITDQSNVITGPASSVKASSTNADKATKQADAEANAKVAAVTVPKGAVRYLTNGMSDFSGGGIHFNASSYIAESKEEQDILDDFVARKLLIVAEDKR